MEDRSFFTEEGRHGTDRRPMEVLRCRSGPGAAMPARYLAPRHWHEEVEILYFTQGRFTVELDLQEIPFAPGEICPVNAGTLHQVQSEAGASEHLALLFDPRILAFSYADEVQQRLVAPLLAGQTGLCSKVVPGDPAYLPLRGALLALQQLYAAQGPGWYIRAKLQLLELLAALGETGALRPTPQGRLPGEAVARYKAVVSCIAPAIWKNSPWRSWPGPPAAALSICAGFSAKFPAARRWNTLSPSASNRPKPCCALPATRCWRSAWPAGSTAPATSTGSSSAAPANAQRLPPPGCGAGDSLKVQFV